MRLLLSFIEIHRNELSEQYPYTLKPIHDARIVYGKPMGVKKFDRMADELYSFIYGKMIVDGIIPKDCIK